MSKILDGRKNNVTMQMGAIDLSPASNPVFDTGALFNEQALEIEELHAEIATITADYSEIIDKQSVEIETLKAQLAATTKDLTILETIRKII